MPVIPVFLLYLPRECCWLRSLTRHEQKAIHDILKRLTLTNVFSVITNTLITCHVCNCTLQSKIKKLYNMTDLNGTIVVEILLYRRCQVERCQICSKQAELSYSQSATLENSAMTGAANCKINQLQVRLTNFGTVADWSMSRLGDTKEPN